MILCSNKAELRKMITEEVEHRYNKLLESAMLELQKKNEYIEMYHDEFCRKTSMLHSDDFIQNVVDRINKMQLKGKR